MALGGEITAVAARFNNIAGISIEDIWYHSGLHLIFDDGSAASSEVKFRLSVHPSRGVLR